MKLEWPCEQQEHAAGTNIKNRIHLPSQKNYVCWICVCKWTRNYLNDHHVVETDGLWQLNSEVISNTHSFHRHIVHKYTCLLSIFQLCCISCRFPPRHKCRCSCHVTRLPGNCHLEGAQTETENLINCRDHFTNALILSQKQLEPGEKRITDSCSFPSVCTVTRSFVSVSSTSHLCTFTIKKSTWLSIVFDGVPLSRFAEIKNPLPCGISIIISVWGFRATLY